MITESIITKLISGDNNASITYGIIPMMSDPFNHDSFPVEIGAILLTIYPIFCGAITLIYLISRMQLEKNSKMRDFMRMMGMNDTPYYFSYFIIHFIISALASSIITAVIKISFELNICLGILYIQIFLIYINIFFFAILLKYFYYIFSNFFSNGGVAKIVAGLAYILLFLCPLLFVDITASNGVMIGFSFIPHISSFFNFYIIRAISVLF